MKKIDSNNNEVNRELQMKTACYDIIFSEIADRFRLRKFYTLSDVWKRYCYLLQERGLEAPTYDSCRKKLKLKILERFKDGISFVQQYNLNQSQLIIPSDVNLILDAVSILKQNKDDEKENVFADVVSTANDSTDRERELMLFMYHTAAKIRSDILALREDINILDISEKNAKKIIPNSLYRLISLMCGRDMDENDLELANETKCLSVCQDIVHVVSNGSVTTPKHVGLAVTIHQATRSKELINLMHSAGHCVSYDYLRRIDTAIAMKANASFLQNGFIPVPQDVIPGFFFSLQLII
jgi:hypothetical protein